MMNAREVIDENTANLIRQAYARGFYEGEAKAFKDLKAAGMAIVPVEATKGPERLIADYEAAYLAANGHSAKLRYRRGWFQVDDSRTKGRASDVIVWTKRLRDRAMIAAAKDQTDGR